MFADEPTPEETQPAAEEQPEPEAPATPETPSEPEVEPEAEAEPEAPEAGETPEQAEARKWADKYDSPEKLEEAYRHQVSSATRLAQERAEMQRRLQEYEEALPRVAAYVEQLQKAAQQQVRPPQVPDDIDLNDPEQLQAFINAQVQQGVQTGVQQALGPLQQQQQEAQRIAQEQAQHEQMRQQFATWQADNPEVQPGSDMWTAMNNVLYELQYDPDQGQPIPDNFPTTPEIGRAHV